MSKKIFITSGLFFFIFFCWIIAQNNDKDINQRISEINKQLKNLETTKDSILNQIYNIELRYEKQVIIKNNLERQNQKIKRKIAVQEKKKQVLVDKIVNFKDDIKKVLRILYKTGGDTYLKLFLRINDFNQLFKNYHLFVSLVDFKSQEINQARETIFKIIEIKKNLDNQRIKLKKNTDLQKIQINELKKIKNSKINLLKDINNDKRTYIKHLNELKLQAEKLNSIITEQKNIFQTKKLNIEALRKKIPWPLKGKIISTFGKKRSKKFDTYTLNNGIEIAPESDDSIKSILAGNVMFAEYFKGFGNTIIIQHSVELFSIYGHCRKLYVKAKQSVEEGELIALVGNSGSLKGKSLYFEIRLNVKAQNPLNWLQQR